MILLYSYAVILILGGAIGYLKSASTPSLVMGLLSGLLVAYGASLTSTNKRQGNQLIMLVSLGLLIFMGMRFYNSQKFMPAGLVSLFSLIVFAKTYFEY
ncbi:transmembrane protein 14 A [Heterostelium album PN500]|uniref:Transmembrane protein 14 A n=1 Tax=Heterostelium pallidum (strain ATCC 26659 / Pp 5 / PN500) TaxID=670386 RepID=D3B7T1_HETP5|nr:transmembrane protein 14 A [Heterostelium album PN500]EFA82824.1 transmembrane protein 14 A [Heterostelium album PN500]|eukprot:XP_020434941.1 transmembrane protein 14 A [Heterostelium album PN500]